jgi:hypothetical protein
VGWGALAEFQACNFARELATWIHVTDDEVSVGFDGHGNPEDDVPADGAENEGILLFLADKVSWILHGSQKLFSS